MLASRYLPSASQPSVSATSTVGMGSPTGSGPVSISSPSKLLPPSTTTYQPATSPKGMPSRICSWAPAEAWNEGDDIHSEPSKANSTCTVAAALCSQVT